MDDLPDNHKKLADLAVKGFRTIETAKVIPLTEHHVVVMVADKEGRHIAWSSNSGVEGPPMLMERALRACHYMRHFHPDDLKETFEARGDAIKEGADHVEEESRG